MQRDIECRREAIRKRYVASKRHTIQVDFDDYMRELEREMKAGARRAARGQRRPIVHPRARVATSPAAA